MVPPMGFHPRATIDFLHEGSTHTTHTFPNANTCINCLKLPLYTCYNAFKEKMDFALGNTYGFGMP